MKKKHIFYTLSTIPLAITISNVTDSDAFFKLDNLITKNKTVSDIVEIKDENLLKAINNQLGRGEVLDSVTIDDMERLTVLNAESKNISLIEGLEYAVNLVELRLYNNNISNIEPLKDLVNLEILHIGKNNISSLEALKKLTNLKKLYFHGNKVSSVEPLRNLIQLTTLHIGDGYYINGQWYDFKNNVTDISPLANLTKLKYLRLENNQVSDISALSNLVNLNELYLYRNKVVDITPLTGLINLKNLRLNENQISNVSALSNMTNLNELYLSENRITDITPLSGLINLKELRLHFNQISNISALSNLTNLNNLWLGTNQISDISSLSNLTNLKDLRLDKNQISNISALSNLTNLSFLQLNNNQISDISPLGNLTSLTKLYLYNNQISDISSLSNLTNLSVLYLYTNKISDIFPLSDLTNLSTLYLNNNQISDISVLSNIDKLKYLDLGYNRVVDFSIISSLTNLKELYLNNNRIFDISSINDFKSLTKLRLENQKPIIELEDFKSETNALDISIDNPIIGLNNRVSNISSISNNGIYENRKLEWNNLPLGNHSRTFKFTENVTIGSETTTFNGTATLNFDVVDSGAPETDHTSEFDSDDFGIYTTVTANDLGTGVDYLMHKGVRQSLPYRFKYDILEPINNIVEVYDLVGNKAEYQVKLKDSDIPTIEEGLDALVNKSDSEKEDISYFRKIINDLDESMNKDLLQNRLNDIYPKTLTLDRELATSNMDVYIKSENILQMALDTNSITFEDFSGIEDMEKLNALNITINSSLSYQINAYLPAEIQNSDKSVTMDKSILNIKESSETAYQTFINTTDKIVLKDNCSAGNQLTHGVDLKLAGGIAHEKDVYKAIIKIEVEQK